MNPTDFTDYAEYLETAAPEIVEEFNKGYEHPTYLGSECQRCFSTTSDQGKHNAYHRSLSLALYAIGSGMNSIAKALSTNE